MRSKRPAFALPAALLAALLFCTPGVTRAQRVADEKPFALVLSAGGGWSRYLMPLPMNAEVTRGGPMTSLRLMWHPDHRLRVGLESGWTSFYSYTLTDVETGFGSTDARLSLSAVPMLLVFSMQVWHGVELFGGAGAYLVNSHTDSFGTVVDVDELSQGWMFAAAWSVPLSQRFFASAELSWYGATQFEDAVLALQVRLGWRVIEW
ncbi:MAG: hypothetical protein HY962_14780 [Ignavibacteriae bacterium]|nr:hypothetical protein [Ignavibacteriota bacterium]